MSKRLARVNATVPAPIIGIVIGELNRIGGWLDDLSEGDTFQTITARVPIDAVPLFRLWLADASEGRGKVAVTDHEDSEDA